MIRHVIADRPLSRRLDRCDRVIQNESRDPFGGNVYYVTMQIRFFTRKFRNGERNLHCDVVHITTKGVSSLTLDCNGVFAIKAYGQLYVYILCVFALFTNPPLAGAVSLSFQYWGLEGNCWFFFISTKFNGFIFKTEYAT